MKSLLITVIAISLLSSCSNYYKAALGSKPATASSIENLKTEKKYFILRDGNQAFAMDNITFSSDQKNLQCTLGDLPIEHKLHLTSKKMKYNKTNFTDEDQTAVLNEVHLYINSNGNTVAGAYTIPLEQVKQIEIIEEDKTRTRKSHTTGVIVGVAGSLVLAGGIVAIIAASAVSGLWYH